MDLATTLWVGAAGFFGVITRYVVDQRLQQPMSTWVVNLVGAFLMGVLWAQSEQMGRFYAILATGFLGGMTTFSALSLQGALAIEQGAWVSALLNVLGSCVLGVVCCGLGLWIGSSR